MPSFDIVSEVNMQEVKNAVDQTQREIAQRYDFKDSNVTIKQALNDDEKKRINKLIKETKLKVTSQIQGDQVRVTGKKRDDLQSAIATLRSSVTDIELQFTNFRE